MSAIHDNPFRPDYDGGAPERVSAKPFEGQQLVGHVSPETAYVVDDYPYGFRLRCKIRYWVETKLGFGQRFVSQTTNPKKPGEVWNKPKAGTYSPLVVMYQAVDSGHVKHVAMSWYDDAEKAAAYGELELDEFQRKQQLLLAGYRRVGAV